MNNAAPADRSLLFRDGVICSKALSLLLPGKLLNDGAKKDLAEASSLLTRMIDVQNHIAAVLTGPETQGTETFHRNLTEFVQMGEVIEANAWRFPNGAADCFRQPLATLRAVLQGEVVSSESLAEARAFLNALANSILSTLQTNEPDDED